MDDFEFKIVRVKHEECVHGIRISLIDKKGGYINMDLNYYLGNSEDVEKNYIKPHILNKLTKIKSLTFSNEILDLIYNTSDSLNECNKNKIHMENNRKSNTNKNYQKICQQIYDINHCIEFCKKLNQQKLKSTLTHLLEKSLKYIPNHALLLI